MSDRDITFSKLRLKRVNNEITLSVSGEFEESGKEINFQFIFEPVEAFALGSALVCQSFEAVRSNQN
jgi:hypothetical protein